MLISLLLYALLQTVSGSSLKSAYFERDSIDKCYDPPTSIESFDHMSNATLAQCALSNLNKDSWRFLHCSVDSEKSCSVGGVSSLPGSYNEEQCQCYSTKKMCIDGDCACVRGLYGDQCQHVVTDCMKAKQRGMGAGNQVTWIKPNPAPETFLVLCDYAWGWTYIQYRPEIGCGGREEFFRPWKDYVNGFGNVACEHWLGLEKIHQLTSQGTYRLQVSMSAQSGWAMCYYRQFYIDAAFTNYTLHLADVFSHRDYAFIGDSLLPEKYNINGKPFSTYDHNSLANDCPMNMRSGWWFSEDCTLGNLNGPYRTETELTPNQTQARITWDTYADLKNSTLRTFLLRIK